jgi:predicted TIM-barrel fold metal-dependent hydrolase
VEENRMTPISRRQFLCATGAGVAGLAALGCTHTVVSPPAASQPQATDKPLSPLVPPSRVIDAHLHYIAERAETCLQMMQANNIKYFINHGFFWSLRKYRDVPSFHTTGDDYFFRAMDKLRPYKNRLGAFYDFEWEKARTNPRFFEEAPAMLQRAVEAGALGVKIWKDLGLWERDADGKLIAVDDPRLFPVWERAEKLGCIVSIHVADFRQAFAKTDPPHRKFYFADSSIYPTRDAILAQRNNLFRKFPKVKFNGCHFLVCSDDIQALARQLDEFPNVSVDTSAAFGELIKKNGPQAVHDFFVKYQDRIMFGTDFSVEEQHAWGANGLTEYVNSMYEESWRTCQTWDTGFGHVTDVKKQDVGIGLPEDVCKKIYWDNAYQFYGLQRLGVG